MYVQPDYRVPSTPVDSSGRPLGAIGVQTEAVSTPGSALGNQLGITTVAKYTQPGGTDKPAAPVAGQLADAMGKSKHTFADGHSSST